ncbi:hypothetical protein ALC53_07965 [Atta colombica]|uniref:Uncharacterized protein n=1 Tax=Atta colombica TaxID=520822 RepID=A0A195BAL3_9HYME|nr:hypothetical protein ALC53_07965 [Atta colombica]
MGANDTLLRGEEKRERTRTLEWRVPNLGQGSPRCSKSEEAKRRRGEEASRLVEAGAATRRSRRPSAVARRWRRGDMRGMRRLIKSHGSWNTTYRPSRHDTRGNWTR